MIGQMLDEASLFAHARKIRQKEEFKAQVAKAEQQRKAIITEYLVGDKTVTQIARALGVGPKVVSSYVKEFEREGEA